MHQPALEQRFGSALRRLTMHPHQAARRDLHQHALPQQRREAFPFILENPLPLRMGQYGRDTKGSQFKNHALCVRKPGIIP